jgi:hypothetical protein
MANLLQEALAAYKGVRVIGLDPGETTGACVFDGPNLVDARQLATGLMPQAAFEVWRYVHTWIYDGILRSCQEVVVIEDYRVYSWKTKDHAWAGLHTPRLIGAMEYICRYQMAETPLIKQSAQNAKGFCTDQKLKEWGLWIEGQRHSRDAIRHACFYLLFQVAKVQQLPGKK